MRGLEGGCRPWARPQVRAPRRTARAFGVGTPVLLGFEEAAKRKPASFILLFVCLFVCLFVWGVRPQKNTPTCYLVRESEEMA